MSSDSHMHAIAHVHICTHQVRTKQKEKTVDSNASLKKDNIAALSIKRQKRGSWIERAVRTKGSVIMKVSVLSYCILNSSPLKESRTSENPSEKQNIFVSNQLSKQNK